MEPQDKHRLKYNQSALMDIEPDDIKDHLIKAGVFSSQEMKEILVSQPTPKDRMGLLLTEMENKGQHAYRKFRSVLLELPSYAHLVVSLANTPPSGEQAASTINNIVEQAASTTNNIGEQAASTINNINISGEKNMTVVGGTNIKFSSH